MSTMKISEAERAVIETIRWIKKKGIDPTEFLEKMHKLNPVIARQFKKCFEEK